MKIESVIKDSLLTVFLGSLSFLLGFAQFPVPGVEGVYSDLREIPLLFAIFHLKHVLFIIPLALISAAQVSFLDDAGIMVTFLFHLVGLFPAWYMHKYLRSKTWSALAKSSFWAVFVFVYYLVLMIPTFVILEDALRNAELPFLSSYLTIVSNIPIEMIPTSMVSSLYLLQLLMQEDLKSSNINLEKIVNERTSELRKANRELQKINQQLLDSNKTITDLNENLENIVNERTKQLNKHLEQLRLYAHSNSHEVRAPLARILGLINLANLETMPEAKLDLFEKVQDAATELDQIIFKMNRLLEEERAN